MSNRPKLQHSANRTNQSTGRRGGDRSNPMLKWIVLGVVALVAVAVVVALLASGDAEDRAQQLSVPQVSDVTFEGAGLPGFDPAQVDPAIGMSAPAFAATTFDGVEVSVQPGDGTAKVIGFYAHWCPHCQEELPRITEWLSDSPAPAGVEVIAVSTAVNDTRVNYPPSAWFEREEWPATVVRDSAESEIGDAYGLRSFPYTVVLGGDGTVLARWSGELSQDQWESLLTAAASSV